MTQVLTISESRSEYKSEHESEKEYEMNNIILAIKVFLLLNFY